ncbi:MAG: type II toxin-antitoxin system Phd/YefM family antitoxin [Deltaproteobacteria bacterium]|nr:type II toxin-antitoxin system Phd/YefM family antitoxin [Deltaproteobacteria bacterium]
MATATIRDLRTRFPRIKDLIASDGEVIVTDRGRPAYLLRPYAAPSATRAAPVDYYARLAARQSQPLRAAAARALDEADREDR